MEELLQTLTNYGFPAMVAFYVLWRLEPSLKEQTKAITLLSIIVARASGQDFGAVRREFEGTNK